MTFGINAIRNAISGFKPATSSAGIAPVANPTQNGGGSLPPGYLSPHFSLAELTISQTASRNGLSNTPPAPILANMRIMAAGMEDVRALLGVPIHVNSGYRAPAVNAAVGGSVTSAHCKGWACDFIAPAFGAPLDICKRIVASPIVFDQIIEEGTWVHLSFDPRARRQVLTKARGGGYTSGLKS
jgi:hypothetical protein